jgi:hypothetical protein
MILRFTTCLFILATAVSVPAQEQRDTAETTIAGKKVKIEYGSPALEGRNLQDLMKQLPADRIWRAGAGAVTTIETESDLLIGGTRVAAGKYSLYMHCPADGNYSLVFNSDLGMPLGDIIPNAPPERADQPYPRFWNYSGDIGNKEAARITLEQSASSENREMLQYSFQAQGEGALLTISWETQAWSLQFQPAP